MKVGDLVTMPGAQEPGVGLVMSEPIPCGPNGSRSRVRILWLDDEEGEVCPEPVDWLEVINESS